MKENAKKPAPSSRTINRTQKAPKTASIHDVLQQNGEGCVQQEGGVLGKAVQLKREGGVIQRTLDFKIIEKLKEFLEAIIKHPISGMFLEPVDPEKDGCLDYFDVIKNPMDLGTIKNKLMENVYKTVQEFKQDLYLIIRNAKTYHGKESYIAVAANELERIISKIGVDNNVGMSIEKIKKQTEKVQKLLDSNSLPTEISVSEGTEEEAIEANYDTITEMNESNLETNLLLGHGNEFICGHRYDVTERDRDNISAIASKCHTCQTATPNTGNSKNGNPSWIPDHQPPKALQNAGYTGYYRFYPHCKDCSDAQKQVVSMYCNLMKHRLGDNWASKLPGKLFWES
jgi:hypothetical protein